MYTNEALIPGRRLKLENYQNLSGISDEEKTIIWQKAMDISRFGAPKGKFTHNINIKTLTY